MGEDSADLEIVASVPTEAEAALIAGFLEQHGIHARPVGGYTSNFKSLAPGGVAVLVRRMDIARAKEALAQSEHYGATIDWSEVDVGVPHGEEDQPPHPGGPESLPQDPEHAADSEEDDDSR